MQKLVKLSEESKGGLIENEIPQGYKYQLAEDDWLQTNIIPPSPIDLQFITLDMTGRLGLRSGYASDGPSGPTIDTKSYDTWGILP